jgi:hypothetical protein
MQSNSYTDGLEDVHAPFSHYYGVMAQLVDEHAPLKKVTICTERSCLWFDAECRELKRLVRRLEAVYKRIQKQTETFGRTNSTDCDNSIKESDLTSCTVEFRSHNQKPKANGESYRHCCRHRRIQKPVQPHQICFRHSLQIRLPRSVW